MCTAGLVFAPDGGDFVRYEFLGRGRTEVSVVRWAISFRGQVLLDCFRIFVVTECSVDGFLLGVCK